jgi:hypothetical protein
MKTLTGLKIVGGISYQYIKGGPNKWDLAKWDGGVAGGVVIISTDGTPYVEDSRGRAKSGFRDSFSNAAIWAQQQQRKAYEDAKALVAAYEKAIRETTTSIKV